VLAYPGNGKSALGVRYTVDDFVHLIAAVDSADRPVGWLSTGIIFLNLYARSGRTFTTWIGGTPAAGTDWQEYLDSLTTRPGILARLDSAVQLVEGTVRPLPGSFRVSVMVPYPEPRADSLRFRDVLYDLRTTPGRVGASAAYVRAATKQFAAAHYHHLRFDGFYWLNEAVPAVDTATVIGVARVVHDRRLRLLWIPYYHAPGLEEWRQLGFDEAWLQPNYFFNLPVSPLRLDSAATRAIGLGLGIELEFDSRLYSLPSFSGRLIPYLDILDAQPVLRSRSTAMYEGQGALIHLSQSTNARDRALYARLIQAASPDLPATSR